MNFCYTTKDGGGHDDHIFCNRSIEPNHPQHLSHKVTEAPIAYTRYVADPVWEAYTPCFVTEYADATNTAVIGYVNKKGGKAACDQQMSEFCQTKECLASIIPVFEEEHAGCSIDPTMPIKVGHEGKEWYRWVRENKFSSTKGEGWSETYEDDKSLLKHATPRCTNDRQCDAFVQHGICDTYAGTCTAGPKVGHTCASDEHCGTQVGHMIEGKCDKVNGICEVGKNGIEPVYHIPNQCTMPDENSTFAHTYCGFDEGTKKWHGVCKPYTHKGRDYHGCKPFDDFSEIDDIRLKEHDHRTEKNIIDNFAHSRDDAPWDHLGVCVPDKRNGLAKVCKETHYAVDAYTADQQCESLLPPTIDRREKTR